MHRSAVLLLAALLAAPAAARATVADSSAAGFRVHYESVVRATPAAAYAAVTRVAAWWDAEHSYSGAARNLTLELRPGGCFCEKLAGGGVKHMEVVTVMPGQRLVLLGGLGPLQALGASGAMTWLFEPAEGGTRVSMDYVTSGWRAGGMAALAPVVDGVLAGQFARAVKYANGARP